MAMTLGGRGSASPPPHHAQNKKARVPGTPGSEINVTPMIDVLLVLLIIFMVLFPHQSKGERALIPLKSNEPVPHPESTIVIQIKQTGDAQRPTVNINEENVSWENLEARLQKIYSLRMNKVAFLKGDPEISFQYVADVIDITHHAGVTHIGLLGN